MDAGEQGDVTLPNLCRKPGVRVRNKILEKSIESSDLSYIQEFLASESKQEGISHLSKYHKSRLLILLVEFLDQPLRLEAIQCIYEILNDVGNVDAFSKVLIQRSVDFNKLVFLKGKVDYLKYLRRPEVRDTAENEYCETE